MCELVGADVNMVRKGIGSDSRIGSKFLYAGCGYGGSCFPKDVKALIHSADALGYSMEVLKAVENVNERQKEVVFNKLSAWYGGDLAGRKIAVWGLAFKAETDDMREAPSLVIIASLVAAGAVVRVYDPVAMDECRRRLDAKVRYATDIYDAARGADALLVLTEWKQFRLPSWPDIVAEMTTPLVIDGRNIYDPAEMAAAGIIYKGIGR